MEKKESDNVFSHLWQKKRFQYEDENCTDDKKADCLRYFLGQLDYLKITDK